jgi:hypothetical protein
VFHSGQTGHCQQQLFVRQNQTFSAILQITWNTANIRAPTCVVPPLKRNFVVAAVRRWAGHLHLLKLLDK